MSFPLTCAESQPPSSPASSDSQYEIDGLRRWAHPPNVFNNAAIPLASIWSQLVEGACSVEKSYFCPERCYLLLRPQPDPKRALSGRRLLVLEAILSGVCQNVVSIDMRLSPSSVAMIARQALDSLGDCSKPSRAHPLLMLAARAARDHDHSRVAALNFVDGPSPGLLLASVARPHTALKKLVSPAELCVLQGLLEGRPYLEIARERGTSTRTIANQISSVFRRLTVSGRNELVHTLFALSFPPSPATVHASLCEDASVHPTLCSA